MRTSTPFALFSIALALYAAPFAQAAAGPVNNARQLSDQNLFEVHLQKGIAASHKRLPSEVIPHHERSEEEETDLVMPVAGSSSPSSETLTSTTITNEPSANSSDSARQPSHFIKHFKHRSNRFGKRRLSDSQTALQFERDSEELDSSVLDASAVIARIIDETKSTLMSISSQQNIRK
jgi:hypothetical protein